MPTSREVVDRIAPYLEEASEKAVDFSWPDEPGLYDQTTDDYKIMVRMIIKSAVLLPYMEFGFDYPVDANLIHASCHALHDMNGIPDLQEFDYENESDAVREDTHDLAEFILNFFAAKFAAERPQLQTAAFPIKQTIWQKVKQIFDEGC